MQPPTKDKEPKDKELSILSYLFQSAASDHVVYNKITDFFPALVYVFDPTTNKLVYINKKITDVLGYSYDDLKAWDHNFMNVIFSEDVELVKDELKKFNTLKDEDSHSYNSRLNHKDGAWRYFKTLGTVLRRNESGSPASVLFIAQDITDQTNMEGEIKAARELLDDTEELLHFGTWTWNIKSNKLIIDDLLEFSRAARTEASFQQVDLNKVIRSVITDLELKIDETKAEIKTEELPVIEGIESQLDRVFNNLICNAIKFRKPGTVPEIHISSSMLGRKERESLGLSEGLYYKINIKDNGIGFEPEYAEKIFQLFQRLHGKVEYPGSGVGLAICKKIIERHEGIIYATSTGGKGSVFSIILPQKQL